VRALQVSAVLTLVALGLMVWSVVQPTPLPVILAMSVGQLFGTVAFALYLYIVMRDVRRKWLRGERLVPWLAKRLRRFSQPVPTIPETPPERKA